MRSLIKSAWSIRHFERSYPIFRFSRNNTTYLLQRARLHAFKTMIDQFSCDLECFEFTNDEIFKLIWNNHANIFSFHWLSTFKLIQPTSLNRIKKWIYWPRMTPDDLWWPLWYTPLGRFEIIAQISFSLIFFESPTRISASVNLYAKQNFDLKWPSRVQTYHLRCMS